MTKFSVITPVYNRPDEIRELLESLVLQTYKDFEVLIIEDGSSEPCENVCKEFSEKLDLKYFSKPNTGQGFSRNFGSEKAQGEWLVFYDSDVIVPPNYLSTVAAYFQENHLDAYGGEDRASANFSPFQKAISYAMTSLLTTGGIRSKNTNAGGSYQLRGYNMGLRKALFEKIGGFLKTNMGEDMELSRRIEAEGLVKTLIPGAFVYHKRRGNFKDFAKQILSFGRTRVQLSRNFGIPTKLVHLLPVAFTLGLILTFVLVFIQKSLALTGLGIYGLYFLAIFIHSAVQHKNEWIGLLSVIASFVQHSCYGLGYLYELIFGQKLERINKS